MNLEEFKDSCRLCLGEIIIDTGYSIFQRLASMLENTGMNMENDKQLLIVDFISQIHKVDSREELPTKICIGCAIKLIDFYKFREKMMETEKMFLELLRENNLIEVHSPVEPIMNVQIERIALNDNPFCIVCQKQFSTVGRLQVHLTKKHSVRSDVNVQSRFDCEKCDRSYTTSTNLRIHMRSHSDQKQFKCNECDREFCKEVSLLNHQSIHTGLKQHKCDECHRCFTTFNILRQHQKTHSPIRPHKCSDCPRAFFAKNDLRIHQRIHTPALLPYKCCECGKKFSRKSHLIMHARIHTGERPFKCFYEFCSKAFSQKGDLNAHLRVHTGDRPYSCLHCQKTFNQSSSRNAHMKIHSGQKNHICSVCNRGFVQSSTLNRHMKTHEGSKCKSPDLNNNVDNNINYEQIIDEFINSNFPNY